MLVHLRLLDGSGNEILPVWWSADFFNLLPHESKVVTWPGPDGIVVASGFNVHGSSSLADEEFAILV